MEPGSSCRGWAKMSISEVCWLFRRDGPCFATKENKCLVKMALSCAYILGGNTNRGRNVCLWWLQCDPSSSPNSLFTNAVTKREEWEMQYCSEKQAFIFFFTRMFFLDTTFLLLGWKHPRKMPVLLCFSAPRIGFMTQNAYLGLNNKSWLVDSSTALGTVHNTPLGGEISMCICVRRLNALHSKESWSNYVIWLRFAFCLMF